MLKGQRVRTEVCEAERTILAVVVGVKAVAGCSRDLDKDADKELLLGLMVVQVGVECRGLRGGKEGCFGRRE